MAVALVPVPDRPPSPAAEELFPLELPRLKPSAAATHVLVINVLNAPTPIQAQVQDLDKRLATREAMLRRHADIIVKDLSNQIVELLKIPELSESLGIKLEKEQEIDINKFLKSLKTLTISKAAPDDLQQDEFSKDFVCLGQQKEELTAIYNEIIELLDVHKIDFEKEGCPQIFAESLQQNLQKSIDTHVENRWDKVQMARKAMVLCAFLNQLSSVGTGVGLVTSVSMLAYRYLKLAHFRL